MYGPAKFSYAETIDRAAMVLLAMSSKPDLKSSLIEEIASAVTIRGGRIDEEWFAKFDLCAVLDEIAERTMIILSAALRHRLPKVADEMDEAFGESLRKLLASFAHLFRTL
jgi:hypothetical protein